MTDGVMMNRFGRCAAALVLILALAIVGGMLWFCRYGFSFDDEGFALVWADTPELYPASVTEFGHIYQPIFWFLGHDVALFRQTILLTLFLSGWLLFDLFLRKVVGFDSQDRLVRLAASCGLAVSGLTWYGMWLLAPSYNTLGLQALILIVIGVIFFGDDSPKRAIAGAALLGAGGWLAFLAKPTTAAATAAIVLVWIIVARKFRLAPILTAAASAMVLAIVSAVLIDGSIGGFIDRLRDGAELIRLMDAGQSPSNTLRFESYEPGVRLFVVTLLIAATLVLGALALRPSTRFGRTLPASLAIATAVGGALLAWGHVRELAALNIFHASMLLALPAAALVIGFTHRGLAGIRAIPAGHIALALGLMLLPYAHAAGTNNNYWEAGGAAAIFWIMGGLVFLFPLRGSAVLPVLLLSFALATQLLVGAMLAAGSRAPYRQPQVVGVDTVVTTMGANGSRLRLAPEMVRYVRKSTARASAAGLRPGTPVIDLTGKSPGTLFILGAEGLGQPWMLGGYPGSARAAIHALDLVPCREIGSAWLLVETDGPRSITPTILADFGIDVDVDVEVAASWETAPGMGGYAVRFTQQLLKPTRVAAAATTACKAAKDSR